MSELHQRLNNDFLFLVCFNLASDDEPSRSRDVKNGTEGSGLTGLLEKVETFGADDDDETGGSDTDEESDSRTNASSTAEASLNSRFPIVVSLARYLVIVLFEKIIY